MVTWLLLAHAVVGVAVLASAPRLGRAAFAAGALPMAATVGYAAWQWPGVADGRPVRESSSWVAGLDLTVDLRLDGFGLLMVLIVSGMGLAVMGYGAEYFHSGVLAGRVAGLLVLFSGSMLGVVLADSLLLLYVCWELTSITSWLLIGSEHTRPEARAGAMHALIVTSAGGLAMFAGLVLIGQAAGTWSLSGILEDPPSGGAVGVGLALTLVGVVTKSAQVPMHAWLPGAMVAPTPVSAYLHSATMVKAGIYLAARLAPAFAVVGLWRPAVVVVGLVTMVVGGLRALRQHDLKLLLAMGTVSQLGFLLVLVGSGVPEATVAGCVLLVAHALFKGALFLVVGIVDHQAGTRDRRRLAGFGPGWGAVKLVAVVSAASMAGLPPLLGFVAKEGAYEAFLHEGVWGGATVAGLVAGSVLTVAYSARFVAPFLARPALADGAVAAAPAAGAIESDVESDGRRTVVPPAPSRRFVAPAVALALLTVAAGVGLGPAVEPLVDRAAGDLDPEVGRVHLSLWHGASLALGLSALTLGLGGALVTGRRRVARWQAALALPFGGDDAFRGAVRGLNVSAARVTRVVQSGSLPVYLAVVLLTATALPGAALVLRGSLPDWPRFAETPMQAVLAAVVIGTAIGAAVVKHRFAAVVLLGTVGYGMGLIFVVQGAPDLALTQFAVETLSIVVFMLVLRLLPARFEQRAPAIGTWARLAVAATVAVGVFFFTLISAAGRRVEPVSGELVRRALPEGHGRNVVNVVLVDFRALDTLGEISVLVIAAVGVVALARQGRRPRPRSGSGRPDVGRSDDRMDERDRTEEARA